MCLNVTCVYVSSFAQSEIYVVEVRTGGMYGIHKNRRQQLLLELRRWEDCWLATSRSRSLLVLNPKPLLIQVA